MVETAIGFLIAVQRRDKGLITWCDPIDYSTLETLRIIGSGAVRTLLQLCIGTVRQLQVKARKFGGTMLAMCSISSSDVLSASAIRA